MEGVIAANLAAVRGRIDNAARAAGRAAGAVALVAVGKTQSGGAVRAALAAGQRLFGENRVQEALDKFPALRGEFSDLVLHLIGPLQTNKVRDAVAHFDFMLVTGPPAIGVIRPFAQKRAEDAVLHVEHRHVLVDGDLEPFRRGGFQQRLQLRDV